MKTGRPLESLIAPLAKTMFFVFAFALPAMSFESYVIPPEENSNPTPACDADAIKWYMSQIPTGKRRPPELEFFSDRRFRIRKEATGLWLNRMSQFPLENPLLSDEGNILKEHLANRTLSQLLNLLACGTRQEFEKDAEIRFRVRDIHQKLFPPGIQTCDERWNIPYTLIDSEQESWMHERNLYRLVRKLTPHNAATGKGYNTHSTINSLYDQFTQFQNDFVPPSFPEDESRSHAIFDVFYPFYSGIFNWEEVRDVDMCCLFVKDDQIHFKTRPFIFHHILVFEGAAN